MKTQLTILALIVCFVGCNAGTTSQEHKTAESLLQAFVAAQAGPGDSAFLSITYKPESMETFGLEIKPIGYVLHSDLPIKSSRLTELDEDDSLRFEMSVDGTTARLTPEPIGQLNIDFDNENGVKSVSVFYGQLDGRYYVSTYQLVK